MLKAGTKVNVKPEKGDKPEDCAGTITKASKDGTYEVLFDNGDDGDKYTEKDFVSIDGVEVAEQVTEKPKSTPDDEFDSKAPPAEKRELTAEELEKKVDENRKASVDATNAKDAKKADEKQASLADTPLTQGEVDFIARIRPRMNKGNHQPPPADILRYSQLIKREKV